MNHTTRTPRRSARLARFSGLAVLALAASCVSPQVLADKDNEIATLREERTRLKRDLRDKDEQLQSLEPALAEANSRPAELIPIEAASPLDEYPELNDLGIDTEYRGSDLVISVPADITFPSGRADLSNQGKNALLVVADTLTRQYPNHEYWIEGHTDSDPISKAKFASNRDLSLARAMSVLHYLVEQAGIPDAQCIVAGHGEYRPIAANSGASKARNRRVEIVVHAPTP